ncbi:MAG: GTP-binding protein [Deltaproteobacteria bacterium]|nr:MAG: GTP-binding protein [Deltaproteobacteria bacterium]
MNETHGGVRDRGGDRTPALVVSGFLGSGKTTLVRHLLGAAQRDGSRVAVVSNEFGELGIDQALLGSGEEAYVELEGGCVCCKLSDALVDTLEMLRQRVGPDRVIVETSGVGLPYDTQLNFEREPVCRWVEECAAVVVVNAEQVDEGRDLSGTFEQQVDSADLLLLNKVDLVSESALPRIEAALGEMAPDTPVVRCVHCRVDPDLLFLPDLGARRAAALPVRPRPHAHEPFESEVIPVRDGASSHALVRRLRDLGALRAKGFVRTDRGLALVQGVGRRIELHAVQDAPSAELVGRVVVIRRAAGFAPSGGAE